jgi:hypothetical protein
MSVSIFRVVLKLLLPPKPSLLSMLPETRRRRPYLGWDENTAPSIGSSELGTSSDKIVSPKLLLLAE